MWLLRVVSAWADRTAAFLTFVTIVAGVVLLADWLVASFGPGLWRFTRSVAMSIWLALRDNAEVRALVGRHPRLFGWLGRRFSVGRPSGLYLTVAAALALYFFSSFVSIAMSLALSRAITHYDPQILALLRAFRAPGLTRFFWFATLLADPRVISLLALLAAVLLVMWGRRAEAGLLAVTLLGGVAVQYLISLAFRRPRPPAIFALIRVPGSFSFPSTHAFASLLLAGVIVFVVWRARSRVRERLATLFVAGLLVLAVGLSRVYLGVHWPSDEIASWSLALAWLSVSCGVYLMLVRYRGLREQWPLLSTNRVHLVVTVVAALLAVAAIAVGAQFDPLLAKITAEMPTRPWAISVSATGTPMPHAADLRQLPLFSEKLDGSRQEPVSLVFIGTEAQLTAAFEQQGWVVADKPSLATLGRAVLASIRNQPYPTAPVTPTFLGKAVQDIAFEKPEGTATVRRRHHARFWKTHATVNGAPVWVATASFDSGLEIGSTIPLPTHHIEPNVDAEQAYIADDLQRTGRVVLLAHLRVTQPSTGTNAQGDAWFTQGLASVLWARR